MTVCVPMPDQLDARETRVFASEVKFVVPSDLGMLIRDWARRHLAADPHGGGPFGDEYHTASLYFDTRALDVFHRRGSYARCKYRVRRYGNGDRIFLERKLRRPRLLIKRRTAETLPGLHRLSAETPGRGWSGDWFYRRLLARRLEPACQISYDRIARALVNGDGPGRLTIDDEIRAVAIDAVRFTSTDGEPVLPGSTIVEMKYRLHVPAAFKHLVETFGLRPATASKYRLGMAALGHPIGAGEPSVPMDGDSAHA